MLVAEMAKTVTNILKLSPTHFVSNIRHQHRCSHIFGFSTHLKVLFFVAFWYLFPQKSKNFFPVLRTLPCQRVISSWMRSAPSDNPRSWRVLKSWLWCNQLIISTPKTSLFSCVIRNQSKPENKIVQKRKKHWWSKPSFRIGWRWDNSSLLTRFWTPRDTLRTKWGWSRISSRINSENASRRFCFIGIKFSGPSLTGPSRHRPV